MEEERKQSGGGPAKAPRRVALDIHDLEAALECVAGGDPAYDDAPFLGFLNLSSGAIEWAECGEAVEGRFADENMFALPEHLYEGLHFGALSEFVDGLPDSPQRRELALAIRGKGAFRRFKELVFGGNCVELIHRWSWFETRRKRERIVEWLQDCGLEPEWACDIFQPPPLPDKRADLLRAVYAFVIEARHLPGLRRIALLGSLTTSKRIPKDVDLLVEVSDEMPLGKLAQLKRRLLGKTMQTGDCCGADVFLCDSRGEYLGRLCSWKKCGPGVRQSCEAQQCGMRKFLSDDFQNVRLPASLIAEPPLDLWPVVVERVKVPEDVSTVLIAALR